MEAVILITLLVMCIIIVLILADNSWFKWEKTDDETYGEDSLECMNDDEDEIEDEFEELEELEEDHEKTDLDSDKE